jgi:hypothetical protein
MPTLVEEQWAHTQAVQTLAATVAGWWNILDPRAQPTKPVWSVEPLPHDRRDNMAAHIRDTAGARFSITTGYPYKQYTCRPCTPLIPSLTGPGGFGRLSELLPWGYRDKSGTPDTEASVSIDRAKKNPEAVAKDFWRRSVQPYLAVFPLVQQTIADRQAGIDAQHATARRLCERFPGFRIGQIRGDSIPVYTADSDIPGLIVQYGGRIMTERSFTMSETVVAALIEAFRAEKAANGDRA